MNPLFPLALGENLPGLGGTATVWYCNCTFFSRFHDASGCAMPVQVCLSKIARFGKFGIPIDFNVGLQTT